MSWSKKYFETLTDYQHEVNDAWFKSALGLLKESGILTVPVLRRFFNKKGEER
jgi:hypothetical protein